MSTAVSPENATNREPHELHQPKPAAIEALIGQLSAMAAAGSGDQPVGSIGHLGLPEAAASLTPEEKIDRFERIGVVKTPPRFVDQVKDTSRLATFRCAVRDEISYKRMVGAIPRLEEGRFTEHEGIKEIYDLLTGFVRTQSAKKRAKGNQPEPYWISKAKDMLENLTFIGQPEYDEAVQGIGAVWKAYLDSDPRNQLCVISGTVRLDRYRGDRKSDDHLRDRILGTFSDEELAQYSGRILDNPEDMSPHTKYGRIILLDDWTLSGKQMRGVYSHYETDSAAFRQYADRGKVEINLIAASADRVRNGLHRVGGQPEEGVIPVKAYFESHSAKTSYNAHRSYVTGLHSPVNTGFAELCRKIAKRAKGQQRQVPRLVRTVPDYRDRAATISISKDRLKRRPKDEISRESDAMRRRLRLARLAIISGGKN